MLSWTLLWLKEFNNDYANAAQAFTPVFVLIFWWMIKNILKDREGDYISPVFRTFGKKYKIIAVHKYEKSNDVSWYKHLSQNSRPDQRRQLIDIKSFLSMRFKIAPKNKTDILSVVISRNWSERFKVIEFNK